MSYLSHCFFLFLLSKYPLWEALVNCDAGIWHTVGLPLFGLLLKLSTDLDVLRNAEARELKRADRPWLFFDSLLEAEKKQCYYMCKCVKFYKKIIF